VSAGPQPSGTVTLVFTDIEGSTRLLEELGTDAYRDALAEHRRIVREACARHSGYEVDYEGDAFFYAFSSAKQAVDAVNEAMARLDGGPIRIRVGIHTGEPELDPPKYVGLDVHRAARIMAAAHGGQVLCSAQTQALLRQHEASLGIPLVPLGAHRLKDFDQPVGLYQVGTGSFPPLKTIANTNLPTPASSFLGREHELRDANGLLRATRLFTVTGPGGAGKTRFALELARRAGEERLADYPDGVFSCFLAPLRDPALVLPAIAQCLSLPEQGTRSPIETLASHLTGKHMLVLLDNLEHLLPCTAKLSELLAGCPGLTLLCTSRELLRIEGETAFGLPPLPAEESVLLFCERAGNAPTPAIEELCRRLDGLPLAVELAAARMRLLSPEQLLDRLSQRLDLLKGSRDADPRQQTLRATIQWSHDLLSEREQQLFARLAVFVGGCTLEAAEAVCESDLETLESLLDKSLLRRADDADVPRFWMHEMIRQYAAEELNERGETSELRRRHAEHYLALAERAAPEFRGRNQETWLEQIEQQHANFTTAIEFLLDDGQIEPALRIGAALTRYWERRGRATEGRALLERGLMRESDVLPDVLANALYAAGFLAWFQTDRDHERACHEAAIALYRQCGDETGELLAELELAYAALGVGDAVAVRANVEDCVRRANALGDEWIQAYAVLLKGDALCELGEPAEARRAYSDSAARFEAVGDRRMALNARSSQGWVAVLEEEYVEAAGLLTETIAGVAGGDSWNLLIQRGNLGLARLFLGEYEDAADELCASLRLSAPMRAQGPVAEVLLGLAAVAARASHVEAATRIRGASLGIHATSGLPRTAAEQRIDERFFDDLGESALSSGETAGRAMSLDDAAAYALDIAGEIRSTATGNAGAQ
jgi:predicted ATPase/class 3 adenylate cyclase